MLGHAHKVNMTGWITTIVQKQAVSRPLEQHRVHPLGIMSGDVGR